MKAVPLTIETFGPWEPVDARTTIRLCRVPFPRRAVRRGCVFRVPLVQRAQAWQHRRTASLAVGGISTHRQRDVRRYPYLHRRASRPVANARSMSANSTPSFPYG
jgi:ribosomal protein L34E